MEVVKYCLADSKECVARRRQPPSNSVLNNLLTTKIGKLVPAIKP